MPIAPPARLRATRRRARWAATVVVGAVLMMLAPTAAVARVRADDPPPAQGVTNSWALAPTGVDPTQPGSRGNLAYTLAPGATQEDSVTLWNYSNVPLTFHVYATDAYNNITGDFSLLPSEKEAKDVGTWVKLAQNYLTVPARTSVIIPMTLKVPDNASPGDHTGAVLAASQAEGTDPNGRQVTLDRRTGSRLYIRVTGPATPALAVENLSSEYHPSVNPLDGSLDVTYTVRNVGNIRLGADQKVEVSDVFGNVANKTPPTILELLPGNEVTVHAHFAGVAATVRVSTDVTLKPFAPKGSDALKPGNLVTTSTSHAWAIPWLLVVILLVLLAVIVLVRRRRRDTVTPPPTGPVEGGSNGDGRGGGGSGLASSDPAEPRVATPTRGGRTSRRSAPPP